MSCKARGPEGILVHMPAPMSAVRIWTREELRMAGKARPKGPTTVDACLHGRFRHGACIGDELAEMAELDRHMSRLWIARHAHHASCPARVPYGDAAGWWTRRHGCDPTMPAHSCGRGCSAAVRSPAARIRRCHLALGTCPPGDRLRGGRADGHHPHGWLARCFPSVSAGKRTPQHVAAEVCKNVAGVEIIHVAYSGSGPALIDLVAGQVLVLVEAMRPTSRRPT